jgi:Domain of unknown function (DUF4267)
MGRWAPALGVLIGIVLVGLGGLFAVAPERGFEVSGHVSSALPAIMAGRYVAFGAVVLMLVAFSEYRALAMVLAVGAGMGLYDAIVVTGAGGTVGPHLGAAGVSGLGAVMALVRSRMK